MRRGSSLVLTVVALAAVVFASSPQPTTAFEKDNWPPLLGSVIRTAHDDRIVYQLELTNRANATVPNIDISIPAPVEGARLLDCWAGGGRGANVCSLLRADNTAKWEHPSIAPGRTAQFTAEFHLPSGAEPREHIAWWRWQGSTPGEYTGSFSPRFPVSQADALSAPRVRKNACLLTPQEQASFVAAVKALKTRTYPGSNLSVYDQFVQWHKDAFDMNLMAAHMSPAFLAWHRVYLIRFEEELRKVDPGVNLPYWDWTGAETSATCIFTPEFMGGDGDQTDLGIVKSGPFRRGEFPLTIFDDSDPENPVNTTPWITRGFATFLPLGATLPSEGDLLGALSVSTYDVAPWNEKADFNCSFRQNLEGWRPGLRPAEDPLHNQVHLWVGGDSGNNGGTMTEDTSPNDPVFFLHHANIDRIWAQWERLHGERYLPVAGYRMGQNLHDPMWPWFVQTPADTLDHIAMGYVYASETTPRASQREVVFHAPCSGEIRQLDFNPSAAHTQSMP